MRLNEIDLAEAATILIGVGDGVLADSLRFSLELEGFEVKLCARAAQSGVTPVVETPLLGAVLLDTIRSALGETVALRRTQRPG
jgi:hypothetical protein